MSERPYFASFYRWLVAHEQLRVDIGSPTILDVGCDDASFLSKSSGGLRVGVDLTPRSQGDGVTRIVRADATRLPLLTGSFGCVLAFDVLEHIENDRAVMAEMLRVLAPGGTIWFSTPALCQTLWPPYIQPYANRSFGHVRNGYTLEQLQSLVPDAGWLVQAWYWNEPLLRTCFLPLHALDRTLPAVSNWLTHACYKLDCGWPNGLRGHVYGCISRSEGKS